MYALSTRTTDVQGSGEIAANLLGQPFLSGENVACFALIDVGKLGRATSQFHKMESHPDLRASPPYAGVEQIARLRPLSVLEPSRSGLSNHPQSMILNEFVDHFFSQATTKTLIIGI